MLKGKIQKELYAYPVSEKQGCAEKTRNEFHQGIADGDRGSAFPALAPQDGITEYGDVVVESNLFTALGAMGGGECDRFFDGDPVYAHIQKTPQHQTENKGAHYS